MLFIILRVLMFIPPSCFSTFMLSFSIPVLHSVLNSYSALCLLCFHAVFHLPIDVIFSHFSSHTNYIFLTINHTNYTCLTIIMPSLHHITPYHYISTIVSYFSLRLIICLLLCLNYSIIFYHFPSFHPSSVSSFVFHSICIVFLSFDIMCFVFDITYFTAP